jgi:hypothetical protein
MLRTPPKHQNSKRKGEAEDFYLGLGTVAELSNAQRMGFFSFLRLILS